MCLHPSTCCSQLTIYWFLTHLLRSRRSAETDGQVVDPVPSSQPWSGLFWLLASPTGYCRPDGQTVLWSCVIRQHYNYDAEICLKRNSDKKYLKLYIISLSHTTRQSLQEVVMIVGFWTQEDDSLEEAYRYLRGFVRSATTETAGQKSGGDGFTMKMSQQMITWSSSRCGLFFSLPPHCWVPSPSSVLLAISAFIFFPSWLRSFSLLSVVSSFHFMLSSSPPALT